MANKSKAKRIAHLEGVVVGAGLLLQKLYARYHSDLSTGLDQQVRQCLRDCNAVTQAIEHRKAQAEQAAAAQPKRCDAIKLGEYDVLRCAYEEGHTGDHCYVAQAQQPEGGTV